jgi:hypothetical protein
MSKCLIFFKKAKMMLNKHKCKKEMVARMVKTSKDEAQKRLKIQRHFWNIFGSVEHINDPKLQDAIRKEFRTTDSRLIDTQIRLMQTEGRIRVEEKAKVWIKQPSVSANE